MSRAAADHCAEQANGEIGHFGADHSSPGDRINRYGLWRVAYGENISYGQRSARAIVLTLVIDDGDSVARSPKEYLQPKIQRCGRSATVLTRIMARFAQPILPAAYLERGAELVARNSD